MSERIVIVQGHPDASHAHFCHALADAYAEGASRSGHVLRRVEVAKLPFPLLRSAEDFQHGNAPSEIASVQQDLNWASHIVIIYPLWLGSMPALLKGFLEQVFRPGFAFLPLTDGKRWQKKLGGKSCRIVVTMGMPALVYRWFFGAHSLRSLERNILRFCGIGPIRESIIGMVEGQASSREKWLQRMRQYGQRGE
jgi:putative NADPH-quinone reductase